MFDTQRRRIGLLLTATLVMTAVVSAWWTTCCAPARPSDVILVVVDCLRRDHVSAYGYARPTTPFFDQLAARGMLFTRAYSTGAWTKPAVASLLTGLYPNRHRAVDAGARIPAELPVLGERMREAGYTTLFMNGGNAFISDRFGFERGFDAYAYVYPRDAERLGAALIAKLAETPADRPVFAYLHYMDVHLPFTTNPFDTLFTGSEGRPRHTLLPERLNVRPLRALTAAGVLSDADKRFVADRYDGQIRHVDQQLEALVAELRRLGRWDHTVLIVTADHGEELWEHGNFEHGHALYEEVVAVPLLVVGPGVAAARVETPVSLVDVHATVLALARLPAVGDGQDLRLADSSAGAQRDPLALMGTLYGVEHAALVDGKQKVILRASERGLKWPLVGPRPSATFESYDLRDDPHERSDLGTRDPAAASLRDRLSAMMGSPDASPGSAQEIDSETRERLRGIGYVE